MKNKITNEEFNEAYKQWYPLICKRINMWGKTMGRENAHQTACIALWKCLSDYQPGKSKFMTYLFNYLNWEYLNEIEKNNPKNKSRLKLCDPASNAFEMQCLIEDKKKSFVEDEIEILKKYLNEQENYVLSNMLNGFKVTDIAKKRGVTKQRIDQIHQKIKSIADDLIRRGQINISP